MISNKKTSIILVLKVLEEYSDENHFLTHQEIIDRIKEKYGIELERKSVANSISLLQELDYDIIKGTKSGFALISRLFDNSPVTYLTDAIFSSKSISGNQAKEIIRNISSTLSRYERKNYDFLEKSSEVNRTSNKLVFYNIDLINEAIRKNKWIGFKYQDFDEEGNPTYRFNGYVFHSSPCYLVNNFGRYYFLGYGNKYKTVTTYRVDYMEDVEIMEDRERLDPKTLKDFSSYNSISEYINDHIYMFGGSSIDAKMELKNARTIQYINDWFGKNAKITKIDGNLIATVRCNENALFYWLMQYGEHITLLSPQSVIERIKNTAQGIVDSYKK